MKWIAPKEEKKFPEWYQKVVDCHGDEEEEAEEHLQALLKEIEEG